MLHVACKKKLLLFVALILNLVFVDAQLTEEVIKSNNVYNDVFPFFARFYNFEDTAKAVASQKTCCDADSPPFISAEPHHNCLPIKIDSNVAALSPEFRNFFFYPFYCFCDHVNDCSQSSVEKLFWLFPDNKQRLLEAYTANSNTFPHPIQKCSSYDARGSKLKEMNCSLACNAVYLINPQIPLSSIVPACDNTHKGYMVPSSVVKALAKVVAQRLGIGEDEVLWQVYKHRAKSLLLTRINVKNGTAFYKDYAVLKDWETPAKCKHIRTLDSSSDVCTQSCRLQKRFSDDLIFYDKDTPSCQIYGEEMLPYFEKLSYGYVRIDITSFFEPFVRYRLDTMLKKYRNSKPEDFPEHSKCKASKPKPGINIFPESCGAVCRLLEPFCDNICLKHLESQDVFDCVFLGNSQNVLNFKTTQTLVKITKQTADWIDQRIRTIIAEQETRRNNNPNWCDHSLASKKSTVNISDEQCAAVCNLVAEATQQPSPTSYQSQFPECQLGKAFKLGFLLSFVPAVVLASALIV